ncbi:archaea-specific SMC-related protein [Salinibaculum rarum]|uniref:archaea-specific SMC-related protein n=1 Tax=Salinibaculum rarum TaxID=3058903 RepID=UPI00265D8FCA|nr:archaea-specific SMC-related protein [Salinibaculum sp. KK48]
MESKERPQNQVRLEAENIGGIERTTVAFDPGVTILTGRNATNRTSLLQTIMAALGSEHVSLKGDAEEGHVSLQIGDTEYTRDLERRADTVALGGDPYLDDPELADLFAFLLESNEARRTVALGGDLRDIIMKPVDADEIKAEIRRLQNERDDIEAKIEERESLRNRLPNLESQLVDLDDEIEQTRAELETAQTELDERSADAEEARAEQSELETKMETLQQTRSELDTTEFRLDSERESLESLEKEQADLERQQAELDEEEDDGNLDEIKAEINSLRDRKQRLERELGKLQNVIQFNEEMLGGTSRDVAAALRGDDTDGSLTDQLVDDSESIVCWTCGTEVDQEKIEETIERLQDLRTEKYNQQSDIDSELAELKDKRSAIESARQERREVERRLNEVEREIEERTEKVDTLETKREELVEQIDDLEAAVEALEEQDRSEVLEAHREVNELELQLDRLEDERESVASEIEEIEEQLEETETLEQRKEDITDQLADLRTRIDRIEEQAVEAFNDHMETVLDILNYANIDRIWVERAESEVREGRRKVTKTEFRLHIVRTTDDGVAYEDDFEHLSESEREVTGLIFALAGYLAHEVYEDVPFILLDSLEAIDSERIAKLVDYMQAYADYLVVALLEEDAAALDDDYERVTEI